jgi:D-3-phosphoglycerate dehydrogenase
VTHPLFPDLSLEEQLLAPRGIVLERRVARTEDEVIAAGKDADVIVLATEPVTRRVVAVLPRLRAVVKSGVGVDTIDVAAATEHGVYVANVPDYGTDEVATHAMALLLALVRRIPDEIAAVRAGVWNPSPAYAVPRSDGRTLGIVGFGRIGRSVARKAAGFGWRLLVADPRVDRAALAAHGAVRVPLDRLLAEADFVTLHVPLTAETHHLIDRRALALMRPTAYLVNTSRGGVVDGAALAAALGRGQIAGAALDVLEEEPPPTDHPLLGQPRCLVTAHVAWYSSEATTDLRRKTVEEAIRVLDGKPPRCLINPAVRPRSFVPAPEPPSSD